MKAFLKSKTILGITIPFLVALLPQFGVSFTEEDGALITDMWDAVIQAVSLMYAAYGRTVAKGPLV